ncbi:hypothetical protein CDAR_513731 [Caerostris darwini]|uniref:Uncharacterized protein n=1 Tax=Caerostris darwini TaxID=1538125 RepID=A0AAV4S566_9ARAC|nr:hypothetical protein CDAR_513731 [Caerostris darwini]
MLIRVSASKLIESLTTRSLLQISALVLALVGYTLATGGGNYGSGSGSGRGNYGLYQAAEAETTELDQVSDTAEEDLEEVLVETTVAKT